MWSLFHLLNKSSDTSVLLFDDIFLSGQNQTGSYPVHKIVALSILPCHTNPSIMAPVGPTLSFGFPKAKEQSTGPLMMAVEPLADDWTV